MQCPEEDVAPFRKKFPQFEDKIGKYGHDTKVRNPVAAFAGMMTRMDRGVGQVLDLLDELKKDTMQCWIMFGSDESEENKVFGICVGRIGVMPNYTQYEIVICTGKRRELWEDNLIKSVTDFATANKCKRLSIMARPGWEKVSKKWGWQKKHVQLEKWI